MIRRGRIGISRSIPGFLAPRGWIGSDAGWINSDADGFSWDAVWSRSGKTSDLTRRRGNGPSDVRIHGRSFVVSLYVSRYTGHRFGNTLYVPPCDRGSAADVAGVGFHTPERFGFSRWIARSTTAGRFVSSATYGHQSHRFGIFLYDRAALSARRAARSAGSAELADRFGSSQSLRALLSTRSFAMILMHGLKALAHPTRLRVLELLKDPAAFKRPRGDDGSPLGVTAKDLLRKLRCAQPTLNGHMQILEDVGLVESRKVGRFVVYTRDEERIRQLKQTIIDQLLPAK